MGSTEAYDKLPWHHKLTINVVRCGSVPRHISFILDGSRRFAKKTIIKLEDGFAAGAEHFFPVMEWSFLLGVKVISMYTLSLENLKRSDSEVILMLTALQNRLEKLLKNLDYYLRHGIRFNFIGNLSLLTEGLQLVISKIALETRECKEFQVNVFLAYTSRDEIYNTIKLLIHGVENNDIDPCDIDESFFTRCLYTRDSPEVNLLLRSSGVTRLSDFLLWQTASTNLVFVKALWPEINLWHIVYHIITYQRSTLRDEVFKCVVKTSSNLEETENDDRFKRTQSFLHKLTIQADQKLKHILHKMH